MLEPDLNKRYSYADYLSWSDQVRREVVDGFIRLMNSAPNTRHQRVSVNISRYFWQFLQRKSCKVFAAPSDVRFPKDKK